MDNPETLANKC